jgi:TetR/AcrR family transcriptional repressor of nem operon
VAALGGDAARQPESVRVAFADGVEHLVAALSQQNGASDAAGAAQARARNLDVLAHAVGALVMSRACPDDSPLADEILAVSRDAILESLRPRQATRAASRRRNAG